MKIYKKQLEFKTTKRQDFYEITDEVRKTLEESKISEGILTVYSPHTTGAVCINENADPDVITDMLYALDKAFPDDPKFKHMEGNSQAHLKSINIGSSQSLIVSGGMIEMGIWQGIFFCEFDGPRTRKITVHVMGE
ncbi:secondary thiamine-phosphate synthase enzyme YjbQ [Proteiniclasticum sp.]|uniref:secondary thiamine-phosphate synthase enzyme YjbQ n=1 Tax=Proteiniclasticum sp. TaxID=2053595 RepID=UPI00289BA4CB|nr:secondary thiamine-phosphate synthase enzyme YjbQ [Proteiniclasticum sp.]